MTEPQTDYGKFLQRFLHLIQISKWELEWQLQSDKPRRHLLPYINKIDWILRDIRTSSKNEQATKDIFDDITSEHAKDVSLWFEFGLNVGNIDNVLNALKKHNDSPVAN